MIDVQAPDRAALLLSLALDRVRASGRESGTVDVMRAREVLDAAALLNLEALVTRAQRLLVAATNADFTRGAIMNFEYDAAGFDRLRQRRPRAALELDFPTFQREDVAARAAWEKATHLAWTGASTEALTFALAHPRGPGETPLHVEVAMTCAVRGDFETCRAWIADGTVAVPHSHTLRMVLVIELARASRWADASRELSALQPLDAWTATCLALGLEGRCPWSIYPFADY
jgi:hypothetical protein